MAEFSLTNGNQPPRIPNLPSPRAVQGDEISRWREEIALFYNTMTQFQSMEPDEVFIYLSGFSARASEIRSLLVQRETRQANSFRTQTVDKFLEECDRQFKIHSRIQAIREFDLRMTGGAPS